MPEINPKINSNVNIDDIKKELLDIKTGIITEINKNTQSEWSAHANWKNSSRELNGDFQISSRLVLSDKFNADKDLVKLSQQASSDKLIEVANSLKEILSEKK
ncbi:hypothetical protein [Calidifontibacillus erzurumensis]|uniref:Uncharacterized protein n=1 Tax=Calidifontibacillus erzurumensis TaxID=2741433 RepID=A0A8J8GF39_9BACI|nr:hypothetical protein [Calidifontibacillus erzurumensis]NSL52167.1 hypothetical protein [Calidifontibacillus erzurumensis]